MRSSWRGGNRVRLLENGAAFFPRVFEVIGTARHEVLIETFILFDDKVGRALREVLIDAATRGVQVSITVDGYGSPDLSAEFINGMTAAGVVFRVFDPQPTLFGLRTNLFRRMHRKLLVVDRRLAFVGGINFSADHLDDYGPEAKQDYSVEIEGPAVADIHDFLLSTLQPRQRWRWWRRRRAALPLPEPAGNADVLFVTRDNDAHRTDIERGYRLGVRLARQRLVIANAYFFPGYRLLRDIRNAARRGVAVQLILQGQPDVPLATAAARWLYRYLIHGGVEVHEYCRRPLHGKVAYADDEWVTVGSSNLDPLSLSVNLEANVFVRDRGLTEELHRCLQTLARDHCRRVDRSTLPPRSWWRTLWGTFVFHVLRRFPRWAGMLPAHAQRIRTVRLPLEGAGATPVSELSGEAPSDRRTDPPLAAASDGDTSDDGSRSPLERGVGGKAASRPHAGG